MTGSLVVLPDVLRSSGYSLDQLLGEAATTVKKTAQQPDLGKLWRQVLATSRNSVVHYLRHMRSYLETEYDIVVPVSTCNDGGTDGNQQIGAGVPAR